jgi:hypothetical protein
MFLQNTSPYNILNNNELGIEVTSTKDAPRFPLE